MKIVVLCNHSFGFPTIIELAKSGLLDGIVTSNVQAPFLQKIAPIIQHYKCPLLKVTKHELPKKLSAFLKNKKTDLVLVLTFKYKIPAKLLSIPKWGFINFHPGPLPQFRGPDPVFWQLKNQALFGVVSAHHMDAQFDTGPTITATQFPIAPEMTHNHFMSEAGYVTVQLVGAIVQTLDQTGILPSQIQDNNQARYLNRPSMSEMQIKWQEQTATSIRALVNACNPIYGGAITIIRHQPLQILQVTPINKKVGASSGKIVSTDQDKGLLVACKDGQLRIDIVQSAEGIMTGNRFVAMAGIKEGEIFI